MGKGASHICPCEDEQKYRLIHISRSWRPKPCIENTMFLDEESSDVVILVESGSCVSRYPCHLSVLKKHVPLLLNKEFDEDKSKIMIYRFKPEVVEQVLRYIYERSVSFDDWTTARDVLTMAAEYEMKDLVEECVGFLKESITVRNVCYLLELAFQYKLKELESVCYYFYDPIAFIILKTKGFYEATQHVVIHLTERDDISVENELCVFNALWKWSKTSCIRQEKPLTVAEITDTFKDVKDCVRFDLMEEDQKKALPESVQRIYKEKKDNKSLAKNKKRGMQYMAFDSISATAVFECKPLEYKDYRQSDHIICWRFSLNIDSYLLEVITMCEDDTSNTKVKKLKIVGEHDVEFSWEPSSKEVDFLNFGSKQIKLRDSPAVDFTVTVTQFRSIHMLLLLAGTYSIEIEPQNNTIKWPSTDVTVNNKYSDVVLISNTGAYGLAKLQFLQAY